MDSANGAMQSEEGKQNVNIELTKHVR